MEFNNVIKNRRSIRSFTDHYVTDEELFEAMESVKYAPSWANSQCWNFIAIRDKNLIEKLVECYPKNPASKCSKEASLILVASYEKNKSGYYKKTSFNQIGTWGMFDLGLACQNLSLKLHEMGLASVMVGAYDFKRAKQILELDDSFEIGPIIPIGKPLKIGNMPKENL